MNSGEHTMSGSRSSTVGGLGLMHPLLVNACVLYCMNSRTRRYSLNAYLTAAAVYCRLCVVVPSRVELPVARAHKAHTSLGDGPGVSTSGSLHVKGGEGRRTCTTRQARKVRQRKTNQTSGHQQVSMQFSYRHPQGLKALQGSQLLFLTLQQLSGRGGYTMVRVGSNSLNSGQANNTPALLTGRMLPQVARCRMIRKKDSAGTNSARWKQHMSSVSRYCRQATAPMLADFASH